MYLSPDFYKFSEISIKLAKFANQFIGLEKIEQGVDLFAGQGIVGIEFLELNNLMVKKFSFIEKETDFMPALKKNLLSVKDDCNLEIHNSCVFETNFKDKFDLILLNPPFHESQTGRYPHDIRKRNCHFMNGFDFLDILKLLSEISVGNANIFIAFNKEIILDNSSRLKITNMEKVGKEFLFKIVNK